MARHPATSLSRINKIEGPLGVEVEVEVEVGHGHGHGHAYGVEVGVEVAIAIDAGHSLCHSGPARSMAPALHAAWSRVFTMARRRVGFGRIPAAHRLLQPAAMRPFTLRSLRHLFAVSLLPALAVGPVACSSSTEDARATAVDGEAACGQYFVALSQQDSSCIALGIAASSIYQAAEKSTFVNRCILELAAPGTSWTPAFLSGCAAEMQKARTCESKTAACEAPAGSLADGAPCAKHAQCKGRLCNVTGTSTNGQPTFCGTCATRAAEGGNCRSNTDCDKALFCLAGKCAKTPTPLGNGAICAQTDASGARSSSLPTLPCEPGLFCNTLVFPALPPAPPGTPAPKCEKLREKGERCTLTECQAALRCSEGACVDPREARDDGADCARGGDCKSGMCDRSSLKCKPITVVGVDASCAHGARCGDGLTCHGTSEEALTCVERLAQGAACTSGGPPCATNTVCRNGKCELNDPALCR